MYKEAFPDNEYFKNLKKGKKGKKEDKKEAPAAKKQEAAPQVNHVANALKNLADVLALVSVQQNFEGSVKFASAKHEEAAHHLSGLVNHIVNPENNFRWGLARDNLVQAFENLATKSHSQIAHTGINFHDFDADKFAADNASIETKNFRYKKEEAVEVAPKEVSPKKESPKKESPKKKEAPAAHVEEEVTGTVEPAGESSDVQEGEESPVEEESKRPKTAGAGVDRKPKRKLPKKPRDEDDDGFKITEAPQTSFEKHYGRRGGFRGTGRGHDRGRGWAGGKPRGSGRGGRGDRGGRGRGGKEENSEPHERKNTEGNTHRAKGEVRTESAAAPPS